VIATWNPEEGALNSVEWPVEMLQYDDSMHSFKDADIALQVLCGRTCWIAWQSRVDPRNMKRAVSWKGTAII